MRAVFHGPKGGIIGVAGLSLIFLQTACGSQVSLTPASTPLPVSAKQPPAGNTPSFPGANLLISVVDGEGQPVEKGTVEVSVEHERDFAYLDFNYSVNLATLGGSGLLCVHPQSRDVSATMYLQVVSPNGDRSDTLPIRNDDFWSAVDPDRDYVATHTFQLGKGDTTSSVVYITEPQP